MRLTSTIVMAFVWLAAAATAATLRWDVTLADPDRPGRAVTAVVLAPATADAPCPVVVIGHATLTSWQHYDYLAEALAEAGWLVGLPLTEDGLPGDQAALALDMRLLASALRDGVAGLPPLVPAAASGPWALVGHSLGGGAAVLAAAGDPDAGALAVMAPQERERPSMIHQAGTVLAPTLVIGGNGDCVTPPAEHHAPLFAALASPVKAYCVLVGGGHCGFAGELEVCTGAEASCPADLTSEEHEAHALALVVPWLRWQLGGQADAGSEFLLACDDPDLEVTIAGLPTAAPAKVALRLVRLDASGAGSRWSLSLPGPDHVEATVFDLRGRRVRDLVREAVSAGEHLISWDGRDQEGRRLPSGIYLLRVDASGMVLRDRTVIVR